eukprot:117864-Ditylum_brightwellii.AAC.1
MYGLLQAGCIAHYQLKEYLEKYGYKLVKYMLDLWTHAEQDTAFCLVVDDFGIKYTNEEDVHHLLSALKDLYKVSIDWIGALFCDIHLEWDYDTRTVDLSMPGYIKAALHKY